MRGDYPGRSVCLSGMTPVLPGGPEVLIEADGT